MVVTARPTRAADAVLHRLLATPAGVADPYPLYRQLRQLAPFYRSELDGSWYASRFADCRQVLVDPRCGRKPRTLVRGYATDDHAFERFGAEVRSSMLTEDPPVHTRLRKSVSAFFGPAQLRTLRPGVEAVVDRSLDQMSERGVCDAIAELAVPVALHVAGELAGIPPQDRGQCRQLLEPVMEADRPDPSPEQVQAAQEAVGAQLDYFRGLVAWRQRAPADDVLSAVVRAGVLDVEEAVDMAVLLFVGTLSPTANLIGNGLYALLRHPGELARMRADPGLIPSAVEEALRYDPPVQGNGRTVHEPLEIAGERLVPGDVVVALVGGANRDPARFCDPERFDVGRRDNQPLSFGAGIHHCLGAGLARLQGQTVFARLTSVRIELTDEAPRRRPSFDQRGFTTLAVHVHRQ